MNTLVNEKIVNSLFNENNFNSELKAMLNQMIDEELVKDIDEMDCDLIEECTNMLIELEQQDDDGFAVIIPLISSEKIMAACTKSGFSYLSRGLRASIIAAIILFSAFTANTVIAKVFDYNIAQEVMDTITEKLEDWGIIANADNRNEVTIDRIPYEKSDNLQEIETVTQPAEIMENQIKNIVNKAPPQNNTEQSEEEKPEAVQPSVPDTDNTVNQPTDEMVNQTYTLTFEISGDDSYKYSKTVTYGKPIGELPVVSKEGYEFVGWYNVDISYYRENGKKIETPLKSTTIYNLDKDAVVVAKWNRLLTINFDAAGGICDTESMQIGSTTDIIDLPIPEKEGYIFFGWSCKEYEFTFFTTKELYKMFAKEGVLNLTAKWTRGGYA
ncbi:MAG: InlB B-repeat-containing protein, partial [Eubacterium sp.]|nr:InlB B-repeat-containing protein [Eubacterium sp.]